MTKQQQISNLDGLGQIAKWILAAKSSDILLFKGEMGAGKTTLIKAICKELQVVDEVSSPTYSLVNEYLTQSGETIYHFDLYRLEHEEEALDFGIEDYLYSGNLCLLEWPEKISNLLPDESCTVQIEIQDDGRSFELTNNHT